MKLHVSLYLAFAGLVQSPSRALTSFLSLIIAVLAPLLAFGVSQGLTQQILDYANSIDEKELVISSSSDAEGFKITLDVYQDLKRLAGPDIISGASQQWFAVSTSYEGRLHSADIIGISGDMIKAQGREMISGVAFNPDSMSQGPVACLIEEAYLRQLGRMDAPHSIYVEGGLCQIHGVVSHDPRYPHSFRPNILIPLQDAERIMHYAEITSGNTHRAMSQGNPYNEARFRFASRDDLLDFKQKLLDTSAWAGTDLALIQSEDMYHYNLDIDAMLQLRRNSNYFMMAILFIIALFILMNLYNILNLNFLSRKSEYVTLSAMGARARQLVLIKLMEISVLAILAGSLGIWMTLFMLDYIKAMTGWRIIIDIYVIVQALSVLGLLYIILSLLGVYKILSVNPVSALKEA